MRNRFKYVCDDCGEANWFERKEFDRAARPYCPGCGSTRLVPKTSAARDRLLMGRRARTEQEGMLDKKRGA